MVVSNQVGFKEAPMVFKGDSSGSRGFNDRTVEGILERSTDRFIRNSREIQGSRIGSTRVQNW